MKKLSLSAFDLGMIVAFVVVALLGFGAYWYLSSQLAQELAEVSSANSDFTKYSRHQVFLPSRANDTELQREITDLHSLLDPLVANKLQAPGNKLPSISRTDTVAWKGNLDQQVAALANTARLKGTKLPPNFYFGFSRYLSQNPAESATPLLSKQLLAIEEITNILLSAPVDSIISIRRTYDQEAESISAISDSGDKDYLPGHPLDSPGNAYTAYPLEFQFEGTPAALRAVVAGLLKSPYILVIRTLSIANEHPDSPRESDLARIATGPPGANADSGSDAGAPKPARPPQYLFGGVPLQVVMRVDLIEWHGVVSGPIAAEPINRDRGGSGRPRRGEEP